MSIERDGEDVTVATAIAVKLEAKHLLVRRPPWYVVEEGDG